MLKFNGVVESLNGNTASVVVECGGSCEECHGCSNAKKVIDVENIINASVGDKVEIVIDNFNHKLITTLIYVTPIVVTLVLALSLMRVVSTLILSLTSLFCFIFFLGCGIILSSKLTKKAKIKLIKKEK